MKKLIAGNWKMNGTLASARTLMESIAADLDRQPNLLARCDFLVCPPFLHLALVRQMINHLNIPVAIGAQDCAETGNGAYTGDISAEMLADFSCNYVILGHSERRQIHRESDGVVARKAGQAHAAGLVTIICVGESEAERDAGRELDVVETQLAGSLPDTTTAQNTVIAYEPVWAIGTGKSATASDVETMHRFIRRSLQEKLADSELMRILYGGSVKPVNAAALLAIDNVDGALIGGASLNSEQYLGIAACA